jgi:fructoselysine 3-epimerase
MKLAFNTWAYSSFPVWVPSYPLEEVVPRLAAIGYDGIELGAATPHAYPDYTGPERRRQIRRLFEENRISLVSMLPAPGGGAGFNVSSPLPEERAAAIDQYKKVVVLCAELGGKIVLYVAGWQVFGTTREEAWNWSRAALQEVAKTAESQGITMCIEPTSADSNLVDSADDALRMMREAAAPNVKLMFDTYHTLYRNEVATDYVHRFGSDLAHVHLADSNRLPPGDGTGSFETLIETLKRTGFDGYLTMEIGFNRRDVDPDDFARRAYAYIKKLVEA